MEGTDGSGKQTQTEALTQALKEQGFFVRRISYPHYEDASSALVKMYLSGAFGTDPESVNPYTASIFYAADQIAYYLSDWKKDFQKENSIIIADRYLGSNATYQGAKLTEPEKRQEYLDWLIQLYRDRMEAPIPDITFWLDVEDSVSQKLRQRRKNKITGQSCQDIHESNFKYLQECNAMGRLVAKQYGWHTIQCSENGVIRPVSDITSELLTTTLAFLREG